MKVGLVAINKEYFFYSLIVLFSALICYMFLVYDAQCNSIFFIINDAAKFSWANFLANGASILFFLCGSMAYLCVPLLWLFFYTKHYKQSPEVLISFVLIMLMGAALESCYKVHVVLYRGLPGGYLGNAVHASLLYYMDPCLVPYLITALLLMAIIVFSQLSFTQAVRWTMYALRYVRQFALVQKLVDTVLVVARSLYMMVRGFIFFVIDLFFNNHVYLSAASVVREENNTKKVSDTYNQWPIDNDKFFFEGIHVQVESEHKNVLSGHVLMEQRVTSIAPVTSVAAPVTPSPAINQGKKQVMQEKTVARTDYLLPAHSLFDEYVSSATFSIEQQKECDAKAKLLEEKLERFGVSGSVIAIKTGPVVTLFEYQPHIDTKISKIIALEDDLALALEAVSIRIIAPIPGKNLVGFEVANKQRSSVFLSQLLKQNILSENFKLPCVLGVDTVGESVVVDLVAMPHILLAGATGSGKSIALNVFLASLLYHNKPSTLKLILIDPKQLEFAPYAGIPHLLFPVVTQPKQAAPVLQWVIQTMEKRYEQMAAIGVRSIAEYNKRSAEEEHEHMPFIVVMIDELADLMITAGKEIEDKIARLAQMARAAGIHLVIATQRPSVDVITGVIKANFPSRIAFKVASKIDSRTILDGSGADKLLGKGDMLYLDSSATLRRIHGAYVSDAEINRITSYVRSLQKAEYISLTDKVGNEQSGLLDSDAQLYQDVVQFVQTIEELSISLLQRKFKIGYNRSARIIEMLEAEGIITPNQGGKTRKVIR